MTATLMTIYLAVSMRVFIAQHFSNFKRAKHRLASDDPAIKSQIRLIARMVLLLSTVFWPITCFLEPRLFLRAFLLGQEEAREELCFKQGFWAAKLLK